MILASLLLNRLKIDDVVGAVPVHLVAGIWGTIAVIFSNPEASLSVQLIGIAAVGAFMTITSFIIWAAMKYTVGIRLHWSREDRGPDLSELGVKAYYMEEGKA